MSTFWFLVVVALAAYVIVKRRRDNEAEDTAAADGSADDGLSPEPAEAGGRKLRRMNINRKWRIVQSWTTLVSKADGKESEVEKGILEALKEADAPSILVERRRVSVSGGMSVTGSREGIVVENKRLRGYHAFVSLTDYGRQLSVSWYLLLRSNWLTNLLRIAALHPILGLMARPVIFVAKALYGSVGLAIPELMNVFDLEELTAYTSTVHHAVTGSVGKLMEGMNMDFSKVDTKSRGFLNVS